MSDVTLDELELAWKHQAKLLSGLKAAIARAKTEGERELLNMKVRTVKQHTTDIEVVAITQGNAEYMEKLSRNI